MKKLLLIGLAPLALTACGHNVADRAVSGAGIGAGAGAVLGPIGIGTGAAVGAITGAVVPPKKVNLGKPVWE